MTTLATSPGIVSPDDQRPSIEEPEITGDSTTRIPTSTLRRAIRAHDRRRVPALLDQPFETLHSHEGTLFRIRTDPNHAGVSIRILDRI
jgi:hypothetical protein